jgi:hypothetical protein
LLGESGTLFLARSVCGKKRLEKKLQRGEEYGEHTPHETGAFITQVEIWSAVEDSRNHHSLNSPPISGSAFVDARSGRHLGNLDQAGAEGHREEIAPRSNPLEGADQLAGTLPQAEDFK